VEAMPHDVVPAQAADLVVVDGLDRPRLLA
jgi:hypothetical protein